MATRYFIEETNEDVTQQVEQLFANCRRANRLYQSSLTLWSNVCEAEYRCRRFMTREINYRSKMVDIYDARRNEASNQLNEFAEKNNVMCHTWCYPAGANEVHESLTRL